MNRHQFVKNARVLIEYCMPKQISENQNSENKISENQISENQISENQISENSFPQIQVQCPIQSHALTPLEQKRCMIVKAWVLG